VNRRTVGGVDQFRSKTVARASATPHISSGSEVSGEVAEAAGVDSSDLFDEDTGGVAVEVDLRPERGGPGAARCGGHDHH
jgi:hypothetical protein